MNHALLTRSGRRMAAALIVLSLGFGACKAQAAELKMMVEPFYTPERAAEVYKPLIDYLNTATGHKVVLVTSRNYHFFWRDVRQNIAVDLMLAEPPITDYRAKHYGTQPIARTAEKTSYTLLVSDSIDKPTLNRLVGRTIVTMPSPSLGFALLLEFFPSPVAQPNIVSSASSWRDGIEIVFAGEADATIVPTWLKEEYPNLVPIRTSRVFPGIALSASATLDAQIKDAIVNALLKLHDDPAMYEVLNELGITKFEATTAAEYVGAEKVLKEFFGYQQ